MGKIAIVLYVGKPRKRTIEILPSGVRDVPILYSPGVRLYISCPRKGHMLLCRKSPWFFQKCMISSKWPWVILITYLLCLVHFNGISMDAKCAPFLLADLFLYYYSDLKQGLLKKNEKTLVPSFNFTLHYTDDHISQYNSIFGDFIHRIYSI